MGWDDSPELPEGYRVGDPEAGAPAPPAEAAAQAGTPARPRIPKAFWIAMGVFDLIVIVVVALLVLRG